MYSVNVTTNSRKPELDITIDQSDGETTIITGKDKAGNIRLELYFDDCGNFHREDGPAKYTNGCYVYWNNISVLEITYSLGFIGSKEYDWFKHNNRHCTTGPAKIISRGGNVIDEVYAIDNKQIGRSAFIKKYLPETWKKEQRNRKFSYCGATYEIADEFNDTLILKKVLK